MMKWWRRIGVGMAVLLGAVIWGYGHVQRSQRPAADVTTIRLAHRHLESGVREAFDVLARAYEAERPGVRVELLAIPDRIWPQWVRTQLVGGTAPDLIELGMGVDDEMMARFFVPLTASVAQPNAFNEGTALAGVPWRNTFSDGLAHPPNFNTALMEVYGIPLTVFTQRMFYNRDLLREITGRERMPTDYATFLAVGREIEAYGRAQGVGVVPVALSADNQLSFLGPAWQQQTAELRESWDVTGQMTPFSFDITLGLLTGQWTLRDPAVWRAFTLQREMAGLASPGFLQLRRDDAQFAFLQGRAVFTLSGSWDVVTLQELAPFAVGVGRVPLPGAEHAEFGGGRAQKLSEGTLRTEASFGLTRGSAQEEEARRFLAFIGSQRGVAMFAEASRWLPSVVGIEPAEEVREFVPAQDGYPAGLNLGSIGGADGVNVLNRTLHLLVAPQGSVEEFVAAMEREFPAALRRGMTRHWRSNLNHLLRQDAALLAEYWLSEYRPAAASAADDDKLALALDTQAEMEANRAWFAYALAQADNPSSDL